MGEGVLVMGFGPFLHVTDNPSARLARAVDGCVLPSGAPVWGRVMDTSYARAPAQTLAWCEALRPAALVGVGVAGSYSTVTVETVGRRAANPSTPDVDGVKLRMLCTDGPESVRLSAPAAMLAARLGGVVGEDAGRYVCNAWMYRMARALGDTIPLCFLHIPSHGLEPTTLLHALAGWQTGEHDAR